MAAFDFDDNVAALVTYLGSVSATYLAALGADRPAVVDCDNPQIEELLPVIGVDDVAYRQDRPRASANNTHQTIEIDFDLYVSATGDTRKAARTAVRDIASAICNDLAGAGAYLNTDRTRVFSSEWKGAAWAPPANDSMVADMVISVTVTYYRYA